MQPDNEVFFIIWDVASLNIRSQIIPPAKPATLPASLKPCTVHAGIRFNCSDIYSSSILIIGCKHKWWWINYLFLWQYCSIYLRHGSWHNPQAFHLQEVSMLLCSDHPLTASAFFPSLSVVYTSLATRWVSSCEIPSSSSSSSFLLIWTNKALKR